MSLPVADLLAEAAVVVAGYRQGVSSSPAKLDPDGAELHVGVDLGTSKLVLLVLDEAGRPVTGRFRPAQVVRDGLVVDFIGAVDMLREMKAEVEAELGRPILQATSGFPPGVPQVEVQSLGYVLGSAGMVCAGMVDEPSAANHVLGLFEGAIVDIGGGTTGIAILRHGEVVHTADEPTGGTHFTLVVAGALGIAFEEAEHLKRDPSQHERLFAILRPVMEKVAVIVARQLETHPVGRVTLVGGAGALTGMDRVLAEILGLPVDVAPEPQLVTPLGIALADRTRSADADVGSDRSRS